MFPFQPAPQEAMGGYGPPTPWYGRQEPYEMHAFGGYGPQRSHIDNSAYYNYTPRWQDYPNYSWNDQEEGQYHLQQQYHRPQYQLTPQAPQPNTSPSFEDIMKTLTQRLTKHVPKAESQAASTEEMLENLTQAVATFTQTTESSSKEVQRKLDQMTQAVAACAQTVTNSPLAQPEVNPQVRNISAITLRSKEYLGEGPPAEEEEISEEEDEITEEEVSEPNARPLAESRDRATLPEEYLSETRDRAQETRARVLLPGDSENLITAARARSPPPRARAPSPAVFSEDNTRPRMVSSDRVLAPDDGKISETEESKDEDEYEDRGDLKLCQENFMSPYFPPLEFEKLPTPFSEAHKDTQKLKVKQSVPVSDHVSAMLQKQLPEKCEDLGMITIPIVPPDKENFVVDSSVHDYSDVVDLSDMFNESACWVDTIIPPDKENHIITVADKVVDPSDKLHTTVLGSCPTLLTPQDKFPVSAVLQVVETKRKRPPEEPKYGGDEKKKVKQVGSATEVHGLRFKPFHDWFGQIIFDAEVPQGQIGYG